MKQWKIGDILAMPANLQPLHSSVTNGCAVFKAKHAPRTEGNRVYYGHRDARELRPATVQDIRRLVDIETREKLKINDRIRDLQEMLAKVKRSDNVLPSCPRQNNNLS